LPIWAVNASFNSVKALHRPTIPDNRALVAPVLGSR